MTEAESVLFEILTVEDAAANLRVVAATGWCLAAAKDFPLANSQAGFPSMSSKASRITPSSRRPLESRTDVGSSA